MSLNVQVLVVGASQNNVVFLSDDNNNAVVIDPSFDPGGVVEIAKERGWTLRQVWLTHGHYDHTAGASAVCSAFTPPLPLAMARGAHEFARSGLMPAPASMGVVDLPELSIPLQHGDRLAIDPVSGEKVVEVRDVSGHSPGSLLFYVQELGIAVVGDAIFQESIGRTDFPGSDHQLLIANIKKRILTLPKDTILIPGHGPRTTVANEKAFNPYLRP